MAGAHRLGEPVSRPLRALAFPAAALLLAGAVVIVGGRFVERRAAEPVTFDRPGPDELALTQDVVASSLVDAPAAPAGAERAAPSALEDAGTGQAPLPEIASGADALTARPSAIFAPSGLAPSRLVAPTVIAPPELASEALQREAPREPLSQLSLALPPPPLSEFKNPWAGKPLFRPVALESAVFESGGHTIAIAGVESVAVEESCVYEGRSWPCGARARGAFRLWLRGRALVCQIPEAERDEAVMHGACRLAKQDVGAWLVENGWALAEPGGPYAQAGEKARSAGLGIFGAPPDASSIPAVPDAPIGGALESQPVMTEGGADPQPALSPSAEFPPAP